MLTRHIYLMYCKRYMLFVYIRDALLRIIRLMTSKEVPVSLYQKLLIRIGLQDKTIIHFSEFFSKFRLVPDGSTYPQWMTTISKNYNDRPILTANQVHALLKEKARQRYVNML